MKYRALGRTGIEVSELGYGAWGIGGKQWLGNDDDESRASLRRAIELGLNFVDTALAYGEGHSERLVGEIVRSAPGKVWIATKVPPKNLRWPAQPGVPIEDVFPRDYIVRCTEKSLKNLGVETIDLQQLHVWNPEWIDSEEWRRAFEDLKKSGKVHHFGVSINDYQPDSALELIHTGWIDAVQVIYNVFEQTPETSLFPLCIEKGIGVLARVPLDEGALTGSITPTTEFAPDDFRGRYFRGDRKQQVVDHLEAMKKDLASVEGSLEGSIAEIALRFCLSTAAVSTVIPGMRKTRNVESSCSVSDQGPLPADVLARLKHHAWNRNFYL